MDIAYVYSFGMFVKVVDYQTDRVVVPVVGTEWSTRRPRTWLPTYTRLRGHWVTFSRVCRLWSAVWHEPTSSHLPCGGAGGGYVVEHPAAVYVVTDLYHVTGSLGDVSKGVWGCGGRYGMSRNPHTCHVMDIRNCWRTRQL